MRWKLIYSSLIMLSISSNTAFATKESSLENFQNDESIERIIWNQTPIPLHLKVNSERIIKFNNRVRVKPPEELDPAKLRIQSVGSNVYLKALESFEAARMYVQKFNPASQSFDAGEMYLIDLRAENNGSNETVQIIDKNNSKNIASKNEQSDQSLSATESEQTLPMLKTVGMIELVRYASQQLYAPKRLVKKHPLISQTRLHKVGVISLYRGGEVSTTPLASWKSGSLYVTAVKVTNKMNIPVELDPKLFRGQWLSRTLLHGWVNRKGLETDTATVFLISDRPFHESII